ncbi:MAG TPA: hypothetical protein PK677_16260 [Acidiphilium sp.]|nr:hypothetical protein [Acidiphilium sp.]HQU24685.1 hypothetical protein [Acidiphilium sp.]
MDNSLENHRVRENVGKPYWTLAELWPFLLAALLLVGFCLTGGAAHG